MITTYGELKTDIADWLDREDLAGKIPSFIKLAETKIYRFLRTRESEFTRTWTEVDNPINPITLPDNFREAHLVTLDDRPLVNISSQEFKARQASDYSGETAFFTIIERQLWLWPWVDEIPADGWSPFTLDLLYYGTESLGEMATWTTPTNPNQVPESDGTAPNTSVRGDQATSRLLQVAPDAYLYGSLAEAYQYLQLPKKAAEYRTLFTEAMTDLDMESALADLTGSTVGVASVYHDGVR